jgi:hypothetical protein
MPVEPVSDRVTGAGRPVVPRATGAGSDADVGTGSRPRRVLFELTHPAHVHLFRHAIRELAAGGDVVGVTAREKDVTTALLDAHGIAYTTLSARRGGTLGLLGEWSLRELRLLGAARRFDPDVIVSRLNPAACHAAAVLGVRSVVFHDTDIAGALARASLPFADVICTPERFDRQYGARQRRYPGYHELAYLHPARFEPDPTRLERAGVDPEAPYAVVRLVSNTAHHDVGVQDLPLPVLEDVLERLAAHGAVHVTSERSLPSTVEPFRTSVSPTAMHDLLAFADVFVGDSATMATEAAVLGTPSVHFFPHGDRQSNAEELESRYGLLETVHEAARLPEAVNAVLARPDLASTWERRRERLLRDKIDVTPFIVDVVREVAAP